jgi:hypothetical protein
VKTRERLRWACVALCIVGGVLCVCSRAPVLAMAHVVAASFVARARFGDALTVQDIEQSFISLKAARSPQAGATEDAISAMVTTTFVATPRPGEVPRWRSPWSMTFRDEMADEQWRRWVTLLRHQPHPYADRKA